MRTSPSQIVNMLECDRKWAFDKVWKVGDAKDPAARDIGTVLHECCERYCDADDQGRDENGQPVDLFPEGWTHVREWGKDTGRRVNLQSQAIIRVLVQQAIDNGTLRRLPDRETEVHYEVPLDGVDDGTMQGYIDQDSPQVVEDHKTTKRKGGTNKVTGKKTKGYALTKAKLRKDPKMLCYAYFKWRSRQFPLTPGGKPNPLKDAPVTLRLNYFAKEQDAEPWSVEVDVPPEEILAFWNDTVIPAAKRMAEIRSMNLKVEDWDKIEGPNDPKACEAYGGCDHAKVCSRMSTVERHIKTNERLQLQYQGKKPVRNSTMSFFGKNKKGGKKAASPAPQATIAPRTNTHEAAEIADEDQSNVATVPQDVPPWTVEGCRACKGTGIIKNAPCRACDIVGGRTGGVTSSTFETWVDDAGDLRWKPAGGQATQPARQEKAPAMSDDEALDKAQKADAAQRKAARDVTPEKATKPTKAKKTPKKTTEKTTETDNKPLKIAKSSQEEVTTGFDLYVGCFPVNHPRTITLAEVLHREGLEMAEAKGVGSYFEINAFERRDAMAAQAAAIAESLKGYALLSPGATITPDERNLLAALEPLATFKVVTLA